MKYLKRTGDISVQFVESLLKERGVKDIEKFLSGDLENISDPSNLTNMDLAVQHLHDYRNEQGKIALIVDSDVDGFCSSTIVYQGLTQLFCGYLEPAITPILHEKKGHGLSDLITQYDFNEFGLVILPDAGSNDQQYFKDYPDTFFLVLDHHEYEAASVGDNYIIVNNQSSPNYPNKGACGALVACQFIRALILRWEAHGNQIPFIDLAALATISDMMDMKEIENRAIVKHGLSNIENSFFKALVEKQSNSLGSDMTPMGIAFYIAPLINAMIRVGTQEEKERMFNAFINGEEMIPSNKRGAKGELERNCVESARECVNAKSRQNRIKEKAISNLEARIHKNDLLSHKILFIELDETDDFPSELNGLIAMQLSQKFSRPTIVARKGSTGFIRGSARGLSDSELKDLKQYFTDTGMFEYAEGHANAHGVSINEAKVDGMLEKSNNDLAHIDFKEDVHEVDFIFSPEDMNLKVLIREVDAVKEVWGQQNPEPLIVVEDIDLSSATVAVMGKKRDTVKVQKNGVAYMFFRDPELADIVDTTDLTACSITIVGRGNLNSYMGRETEQIFVTGYEINEMDVDTSF